MGRRFGHVSGRPELGLSCFRRQYHWQEREHQQTSASARRAGDRQRWRSEVRGRPLPHLEPGRRCRARKVSLERSSWRIHLAGLPSDFAAERGPKQLPCFTLEPPKPELLDRREINWAGVDRDTRQQVCGSEIPEVCGLFHYVIAREIVT